MSNRSDRGERRRGGFASKFGFDWLDAVQAKLRKDNAPSPLATV